VSETFTAGPVNPPFTYYLARAYTLPLNATRKRFDGPPEKVVNVSSSIASLTGTQIRGAGDGTFTLLPGPNGGAPPVIWCCTVEGDEAVIESDGRPEAPRTVAVGFDADRIRLVVRDLAGASRLVSARITDAEGAKETAVFPGVPSRDSVAVVDGFVTWTDDVAAGVVRIAGTSTGGPVPARDVPLGGRILRLVADDTVIAVTARVGAGVKVIRIDPVSGATQVVWSGNRVPKVAAGGGSVVVSERTRLLASRAGVVVRRAKARGPIAAVAADGDRFAWLERVGRGKDRRTVARLGVIPR
jgi:hypothetical protein